MALKNVQLVAFITVAAAAERLAKHHSQCGDGKCLGAEDENNCLADCPGVTTQPMCGEEPHSDRGGRTLTFGVGHRATSAQDCCDRCSKHKGGCNSWTFCGYPVCWGLDTGWNHSNAPHTASRTLAGHPPFPAHCPLTDPANGSVVCACVRVCVCKQPLESVGFVSSRIPRTQPLASVDPIAPSTAARCCTLARPARRICPEACLQVGRARRRMCHGHRGRFTCPPT